MKTKRRACPPSRLGVAPCTPSCTVSANAEAKVGAIASVPTPRADFLRKVLRVSMTLLRRLGLLAVDERVRGQQCDDHLVKTTAVFEVGAVGIDQGF